MAPLVYGLCAATAFVCTALLLQAYKKTSYRLLFWSGLCFAGLTLNNVLLVLDKILLPETDLSLLRTLVALVAMIILLYGLIWEAQ